METEAVVSLLFSSKTKPVPSFSFMYTLADSIPSISEIVEDNSD